MRNFIFFSQSGCLLPFLIIFNLFFGWIFFRPLVWLSIGAVLVMLFLLQSLFMAKSMISQHKKRDDVIDVEGEIVEDKKGIR